MATLTYTEEIGDEICDRIANGESVRSICESKHMPSRFTVMNWQDSIPGFSTKCARARELQAELMDEKIMETAESCVPETAPADRVKISAYQWRAAKLAPKKYGDSSKLELTGANGTPLIPDSEEKINARITELLGKTGAGNVTVGETENPMA